jgi:hypothetical protein
MGAIAHRRRFTGRETKAERRQVVTANALLGIGESNGVQEADNVG